MIESQKKTVKKPKSRPRNLEGFPTVRVHRRILNGIPEAIPELTPWARSLRKKTTSQALIGTL